MDGLELSKSQKKVARQLIETGLVTEFENGIDKIDQIIHKWKEGKTETKDTYYQIFNSLKKFDKHIARRYDGMTGSDYLLVLAGQLTDGAISVEDLRGFDQEVQARIVSISRIDKE